jgi:hypothetical protein
VSSTSKQTLARVRRAPLWRKMLAIFLGGSVGAALRNPLFDVSVIAALLVTFIAAVVAISLLLCS